MLLVMKLAVLHLSQYDTIFLVMQLSVAARKRETGLNPFYQPLPPPPFFDRAMRNQDVGVTGWMNGLTWDLNMRMQMFEKKSGKKMPPHLTTR